MEKQADNRGGEFGGVRVHAGFMPFVGPVHHAEEAEDRDAGVDAGREAFRGQAVEDFTCQGVIAALDGLDFFTVRVAKGIFLVGENFHSFLIRQKVLEMVLDEDANSLLGFVELFGTVAFLGGLAAMAWNFQAVWTGKRRWPAKTWSAVLLFSALVVFWIAIVGKLIGLNLNY